MSIPRFQDLINSLLTRFKSPEEQIDDVRQELIETAETAEVNITRFEEVQVFFETKLGQYIEDRLFQDKQKLLVLISTVSPTTPEGIEKILELQRQLKVINTTRSYIEQVIVDGTNSLQVIQTLQQ